MNTGTLRQPGDFKIFVTCLMVSCWARRQREPRRGVLRQWCNHVHDATVCMVPVAASYLEHIGRAHVNLGNDDEDGYIQREREAEVLCHGGTRKILHPIEPSSATGFALSSYTLLGHTFGHADDAVVGADLLRQQLYEWVTFSAPN